MAFEPNESDGPEDLWVRAHEQELLGMTDDGAVAVVTAAGFRAFVFGAGPGHALAANKVRNTVTLIPVDGVVRSLRR